MQDGTSYSARPGSHVNVSDDHAAAIRRQVGGDAGLVGHGAFRAFGGTKDGRWCEPCRRLWNRWNLLCVKCGGETVPEAEMPDQPRSAFPSGCPPVRI
jgi:hypothetical protein